jgi:WD40 repeat protein/tRNA A-37 threonylcarbamoyl transferase component Bud32
MPPANPDHPTTDPTLPPPAEKRPNGLTTDVITFPENQASLGQPTAEYQPGQTTPVRDEVTDAGPQAWPTFSGYEILGVLGRGGMGVVYKARDLKLKRTVALKVILAGAHAGERELTRFKAEAETVARLQHPNIVQIHEVGEHDGKPFISLEFCTGGSLDAKLDGSPLPPQKAAQLVETLARAMHAAHNAQVIHRDLKPANVLLTVDGTPKITDFGLAKKLDDAGQTQSGAIMGTPSYMAPEQAGGKSKDLAPSADIYALGAILYELLTGRPPFKAATPLDTIMQVVSDEPVPPTRLQSRTPRDLETICLKCLRKEPENRYISAEALAEDLRRWQSGEPIRARPVSVPERFWFWCRRNPVVAAVSAVAALALVAGTIISLMFGIQASQSAAELARTAGDLALKEQETKNALGISERVRHELEETDKKRRKFTRQSALLALEKGIKYWDEGDQTLGTLWLTRSLEMVEDADLERVIRSNLAHVPYFVHPLKAILPHDKRIWRIAFSPDGTRVVTSGWDDYARLWETDTGRPLGSPMTHKDKLNDAIFSPSGQQILTCSEDGTVRLWDGKTGQSLNKVLEHGAPVAAAAFSPDGARIMTADKKDSVRLWDAASGRLISGQLINIVIPQIVKSILFAPGGELAAVLTTPPSLFDGRTGRFLREVQTKGQPDGTRLAAGSLFDSWILRVWDTRTGSLIGAPQPHPKVIEAVVFSPDGKLLATGCGDGLVRLWDAKTAKPVIGPREQGMRHPSDVECLAFSADSKTLLTGSRDGTARLWDVETQQPLGGPLHQGLVPDVGFRPAGPLMATASFSQGGRLWGVAACKVPHETFAAPRDLGSQDFTLSRFTPDGAKVLAASTFQPSLAKLWDVGTGRPYPPLRHEAKITSLAVAADGKLITAYNRFQNSPEGVAVVWDLSSGNKFGQPLVHGYEITAAALSPDGKTALTAASVAGEKGEFQPLEDTNPKRNRSRHNLKEIGVAMWSHHATHKTLLARANFDKDGKPLLSWRVHLLPYLNQGALYKQFRLDEPWDSPANKKLIANIPQVYSSPLSKVAGEGKTTYLAVTGKNSVFDGRKGLRPTDVTDGTSFTIMVVEANDKKAVYWTQPEDFPIDTKDPVAWLVYDEMKGFLTLFADQSIHWASATIPTASLHAHFTRNGGERVGTGVGGIDSIHVAWELARWDLASGKMTAGPWQLPARISRIEFSPDGEKALLHDNVANVYVWNLAAGRPDSRLPASIRISADGHYAADNQFFTVPVFRAPIWDKELYKLTFQAGVTATDFLPGGNQLLTATMDGRCQFWELASGKDTRELLLSKGYADNVASAPDGKMLLVCTSERTARLWDKDTGLPLGPELTCKGRVRTHAAFNKPGSYFLLQDEGGTRLYRTPVPLRGKVQQIVLWAQLMTGMELNAEGRSQLLTLEQWDDRRHRLEQMGGTPQ